MIKDITVRPAPPALFHAPVMSVPLQKASPTPPSFQDETNVSTLSRQLGESAARADARDSILSRGALRLEGRRLISGIFGDAYQAAKQEHNNEVPKTDDPELLERARRATHYIVRSDQHDRSVKNPFAELSREQLTLIAYDELGPYTVNERRAALYGVLDLESQWNRQVMRIYDMEAAANLPNRPGFCAEVIAHFRTLPAIEQAEYPDNYEARLEAQINEPPEKAKESFRMYTLFELLARIWRSDQLARNRGGVAEGLTSAMPADR